jgi:hypothetical protein
MTPCRYPDDTRWVSWEKRKRKRLGILSSERPTEVIGSFFLAHLLHKKNVPSKHTRNFILGLYMERGKGRLVHPHG